MRSSLNEIKQRPDRSVAPELSDRYSEYVAQLKPSHYETLFEPPTILKATTNTEYSPKEFAAVKETRITGTFEGNVDSYSASFWFRSSIKNNERPITAYLFSRAKLDDKSLPGDHLGIGGTHDKDRTGKLFVFNGNNSKKKTIGGSTPLAPGSWNHVVLVREGGRVKVFLNGRLEIDDELEATFSDSNDFCVAMRSDKFAPLVGNVGAVALFDRALSDEAAFGIHDASGQPRGIRTPPPLGFAMGVREKAKPEDCKVHINGDGKKLGPVVRVTAGVARANGHVEAGMDTLEEPFQVFAAVLSVGVHEGDEFAARVPRAVLHRCAVAQADRMSENGGPGTARDGCGVVF